MKSKYKNINCYLIASLRLLSVFIILGCLIFIELLVCENTLFEEMYILQRVDKYLGDLIVSYVMYVTLAILWIKG